MLPNGTNPRFMRTTPARCLLLTRRELLSVALAPLIVLTASTAFILLSPSGPELWMDAGSVEPFREPDHESALRDALSGLREQGICTDVQCLLPRAGKDQNAACWYLAAVAASGRRDLGDSLDTALPAFPSGYRRTRRRTNRDRRPGKRPGSTLRRICRAGHLRITLTAASTWASETFRSFFHSSMSCFASSGFFGMRDLCPLNRRSATAAALAL